MGIVPNLTDETPLDQYTATASQTEFTFTFMIFATSDIKVYVNDVLKTETTDYVVKQADLSAIVPADDLPMDGGKVVFNSGLTVSDAVSISREIPIDRLTGYSVAGAFRANVLNTELTRMQAINQQLERDLTRTIQLSASDAEGGSLVLPGSRASKFLAFDSSGDLIMSAGTIGTTPITVSSFMETVLDDASALLVKQTLILDKKGSDIASASSIDLDSATGDYVDVTGTTAITALTLSEGQEKVIQFDGALILTNGASLILPTGANITTASGDVAVFRGEASSVVRCIGYQRANGEPLAIDISDYGASQAEQEAGTEADKIVTPSVQQHHPSAAKAWVNFVGTGTVSINDSYNVTSITDNGTGDYSVNFTTNFSSANYTMSGSAVDTSDGGGGNNLMRVCTLKSNNTGVSPLTASSARIATMYADNQPIDCEVVTATFFGDQ